MRRPFRFATPHWFTNAGLHGLRQRVPLWRLAWLLRTARRGARASV